MKKIYLAVFICLMLTAASKANTITLIVNNGDWTASSSWNLARVPQANDTIIIPTAMTVKIYSNVSISGYVYVHVYGVISFNHSSKLDLDAPSKIFVHSGGKITSLSSSASDQVRINGTSVYKGNSGDLSGPVLLTSGGSAPVSEIALPVTFISFTLSRESSNVSIKWSTAQEMNSNRFVIERSDNGTNWTGIAIVLAAGESSSTINYNYIDKNVSAAILYYRVKEVDNDGKYIYTEVRTIKSQNSGADLTVVTASNKTVSLNFSKPIKSNVLISVLTASGQLVKQQIVSNPSGQIVLSVPGAGNGIYVVSVVDGKDLKIAKQILL